MLDSTSKITFKLHFWHENLEMLSLCIRCCYENLKMLPLCMLHVCCYDHCNITVLNNHSSGLSI